MGPPESAADSLRVSMPLPRKTIRRRRVRLLGSLPRRPAGVRISPGSGSAPRTRLSAAGIRRRRGTGYREHGGNQLGFTFAIPSPGREGIGRGTRFHNHRRHGLCAGPHRQQVPPLRWPQLPRRPSRPGSSASAPASRGRVTFLIRSSMPSGPGSQQAWGTYARTGVWSPTGSPVSQAWISH